MTFTRIKIRSINEIIFATYKKSAEKDKELKTNYKLIVCSLQ